MQMKSAILFAVLLAGANALLVRVNNIPSDECVRQWGLSWDGPLALNRGFCLNGQRFPNSATTVYLSSTVTPATASFQVTETVVPAPATLPAGTFIVKRRTGLIDCDDNDVVPGVTVTLSATGTLSFTAFPANSDELFQEWLLCYRPVGAPATSVNDLWTGIRIATERFCKTDADCTTFYGTTTIAGTGFSPLETRLRTKCCSTSAADGVCINPSVQSCCGTRGLHNATDRCCDDASTTIRYQWDNCPCTFQTSGSVGCPTGESCCLRSKFTTEYTLQNNDLGVCFNSNSALRCCDTGSVYNSGTHQCCVINGVQSVDVPCPCSTDAHCVGGQPANQQHRTYRCCKQIFPATLKTVEQCTPYANFPSARDIDAANAAGFPIRDAEMTVVTGGFRPGTGSAFFQRCAGQCINTDYEICCNGQRCFGEYERCCNQTCCNKYLSSCLEHQRGPVRGFANNGNEFAVAYAECTTVESMNALRAFWVYVVPTFLLVATLASLAIVILFANNYTLRAYSYTEIAFIVFAVIAVLLALPTFFSPIYKYGVTAVVVALICILSAAARVRWLNVLALGATLLFVLYLFDPFHGNNYWNFASLRQDNGLPWTWASGVIYSIRGIWPGNFQNNNYCTWFYYGYFEIGARDFARWTNPEVRHFGYCDRGWATALLVFQGLQLLVALWLFVLALILLLLRFRKALYEPVELDVVQHADY